MLRIVFIHFENISQRCSIIMTYNETWEFTTGCELIFIYNIDSAEENMILISSTMFYNVIFQFRLKCSYYFSSFYKLSNRRYLKATNFICERKKVSGFIQLSLIPFGKIYNKKIDISLKLLWE